MSLPIDIAGSSWFLPTAIWEWEPAPEPPPPCEAQTPAMAADAAPAPMLLVFKGYAITAIYQWFAADTLLSRPWSHCERDNDARRHAEPAAAQPLDALPRPDDDGDPVR